MPKIVCTTVVRSVAQGQSHGGIFLIDTENEIIKQVFDYNTGEIDFSGRGGGRGLRGIRFCNNRFYVAASNELFVFSDDFRLIKSFKNPFLDYCHEIAIWGENILLTSTAYDSILIFNTFSEKFIKGIRFGKKNPCVERFVKFLNFFSKRFFDKTFISFQNKLWHEMFLPEECNFLKKSNRLHLNSVSVFEGRIIFSGLKLNSLYGYGDEKTEILAKIPYGTHNASKIPDGIFFNHTRDNKVVLRNQKEKSWKVKQYPPEELENTNLPNDTARQAFARGLAFNGQFIIGGSSPGTISVYRIDNPEPLKTINFSKDIRITIHGLEILPDDFLIA